MGLFRKKPYDRSQTLANAAKARAQGRPKKAIAEYQRALEHSPDDPAIHGKLAPLLAQAGDFGDAWRSFIVSADAFEKQGFVDRSLAVYAQAASAMPWHAKTWEAVARLRLEKGQRADALKALLEGRAHLTRRAERPDAIGLLLVARQIDPEAFSLAIDLARLMRKEARHDEARPLLESLVEKHEGRQLRLARGELFRLAPSPPAAWRWLRAALKGR
jgi:tetratricopeptide (TPR) repeat protein